MWRTDSGNLNAITSNRTNGAMPPSASTLRQPQCGIIHAAPSGKPQNIAFVIAAMAR